MLIPFESLPPHSRLWIYQSDRKIAKAEHRIISDTLESFIQNWLVHGEPMTAAFDIRFDHFVIIGADEKVNAASGCSIDKAVRQMTELGSGLGIDWFNRNNVAFFNNQEIELLSLKNLKQLFVEGRWAATTSVFDNTIKSKSDLDQWVVPASQTWLHRYLPQEKDITIK
jgi:hypothetical protein